MMKMANVHDIIVMSLSEDPNGNDIHGKLSNLSDTIDLQLPSISRVVNSNIRPRSCLGLTPVKKKIKETSTVNLTRRTWENLRVHESEVLKFTLKRTEEWQVPFI